MDRLLMDYVLATNMNPEDPKQNFLTSNWLVGVLLIALGTIIMMYLSTAQSSQAQINTNVQNQISGVQSQLQKQTSLLILIATKDGIPAQEIANLTN